MTTQPITTEQVYAIESDQYGWRHLPDGRRVKVGAGVQVFDWARIGNEASIGDEATVGDRAYAADPLRGYRAYHLTYQAQVRYLTDDPHCRCHCALCRTQFGRTDL